MKKTKHEVRIPLSEILSLIRAEYQGIPGERETRVSVELERPDEFDNSKNTLLLTWDTSEYLHRLPKAG